MSVALMRVTFFSATLVLLSYAKYKSLLLQTVNTKCTLFSVNRQEDGMIEVMFASLLFVIHGVVAAVLGVASVRLAIGLKKFRFNATMTPSRVIEDTPSVTVVIPARNESHAMTDCLQAVVNSTYPKLEIIVLNDSSADRTSSLIKAFAHDGIRFVDGPSLPEGWLGKNHALHTLVKEASGSYVLFMDVDTRINPDTIEQMVAYAVQENAAMVSVLPAAKTS